MKIAKKILSFSPFVLLYLLFPLTFTLAKQGFEYGPQILFVGARMALGGLLLLLYCYFVRKDSLKIDSKDYGLFIQAGLIGITLCYVPEFWALKYVSVAKATLIFLLNPFFAYLFSYFLGIEKFAYKKILGLFIGLVGVIPMVLSHTRLEESFGVFAGITFPEFLMFVAVAGYSYGWVVVRKLVGVKNYSSLATNGIRMFLGGIVALIASCFIEGGSTYIPHVTNWKLFGWHILLITFVGVTCYCLYGYLLKKYSATMLAFGGFVEPFIASFYAWIILGETVSWIFFASIGIVFVGLYVFYQEELKAV